MISVGDKYICKRDFGDLIKGNIYTVYEVNYSNPVMVYFNIRGLHYWFLTNEVDHDYYLGKYMVSLKEERKRKLKRLKNV